MRFIRRQVRTNLLGLVGCVEGMDVLDILSTTK